MDRIGKNLQVFFLEILPERILDELMFSFFKKNSDTENSQGIALSEEIFCHYAGGRWSCWSDDENKLFFKAMTNILSDRIGRRFTTTLSVLHIPALCGEKYLLRTQNDLLCRFKFTKDWRDIYHAVGQDLITTAYLAFDDLKNCRKTTDFSWNAVLKTDHHDLNVLLAQGLAENHFHLKGSTQSFPITWCCIMNFPSHSTSMLSEIISVNRYPGISRNEKDNVLSYEKRLLLAAYLRAILYMSMKDSSINICNEFENQRKKFLSFSGIDNMIERIRYFYGEKQRISDNFYFCLDYAIPSGAKGEYRILAGERQLMYHWFFRCFAGNSSNGEHSLFYLYLLLKSHFRREIIQLNSMVGFYNFDIYQKRKDLIWDNFPAYEQEATRMAIHSALKAGNVSSLEARVMPKMTSEKFLEAIWKIDKSQADSEINKEEYKDFPKQPSWLMKNVMKNADFFYVVHFAKQKDKYKLHEFYPLERHHVFRNDVRRKAFSIAESLCKSTYLSDRVRGIDACANEIGCRPEIFATAFRFLRNLHSSSCKSWYSDDNNKLQLSITYHVGEDFLDSADGLRAIDETLHFLPMQQGDRLGHALALGVDPGIHYDSKSYQIVQHIQDRLDDLVWILFRGDELGVSIDSSLRAKLSRQAENLLEEIYPNRKNHTGLLDYYYSWQLRGDEPCLYRSGKYQYDSTFKGVYYRYMVNPLVTNQRNMTKAAQLYFRYHYDTKSRNAGKIARVYDISKEYIDLMRQFQDKMQFFIDSKGISIECNPSSNTLIGTFRDYIHHPIYRFFSPDIENISKKTQLNVSINTDDLGVFDTSLEFEYALITHALMYRKDNYEECLSFRNIRNYIDNIRKMGFEQIFS